MCRYTYDPCMRPQSRFGLAITHYEIYDGCGIKDESSRRSHEEGIMEEESWRRRVRLVYRDMCIHIFMCIYISMYIHTCIYISHTATSMLFLVPCVVSAVIPIVFICKLPSKPSGKYEENSLGIDNKQTAGTCLSLYIYI